MLPLNTVNNIYEYYGIKIFLGLKVEKWNVFVLQKK